MRSGKWVRGAGLGLFVVTLLLAAGRANAVRDSVPKPRDRRVEVTGEPDPGNLSSRRGQVGKIYFFEVTGTTTGVVWGSGVYTDDSQLSTAAVHAGVLRPGQRGVIQVTVLPGEASYVGSTQNGVTSSPYQAWGGSYRIEPVRGRFRVKLTQTNSKVLDNPGQLSGYRDKVGKSFLFQVTGRTTQAVWGSGIYTDDSDLATAAVHAGVLRNGQTGTVKVTILAGQANYQGSVKNGVTTRNWNNFPGSFKVEAVKLKKDRKK